MLVVLVFWVSVILVLSDSALKLMLLMNSGMVRCSGFVAVLLMVMLVLIVLLLSSGCFVSCVVMIWIEFYDGSWSRGMFMVVIGL